MFGVLKNVFHGAVWFRSVGCVVGVQGFLVSKVAFSVLKKVLPLVLVWLVGWLRGWCLRFCGLQGRV